MCPLSFQADKRDFGKEDEVWQMERRLKNVGSCGSLTALLNPEMFWFANSQLAKGSIHKPDGTAVSASTQRHCLHLHGFVVHCREFPSAIHHDVEQLQMLAEFASMFHTL
jgi:hypothetical protein